MPEAPPNFSLLAHLSPVPWLSHPLLLWSRRFISSRYQFQVLQCAPGIMFLCYSSPVCNYPRAEQGTLLVGYPHPVLATTWNFCTHTSHISIAPSSPSLLAGTGLDFSLATQIHRNGGVCPVSWDPYSQQTLDLVLGVCLNLHHKLGLSWSAETSSRLQWMGELALSSSSCSLFPWLETHKTPKGKMAPEIASDVVQPVTTRAKTLQMVCEHPAGDGGVAIRVIERQKRKL